VASTTEIAHLSKIRNAIGRAIALLDRLLEKHFKDAEDILWHAAEETEYASSILSLTSGFNDYDPKFTDQESLKAEFSKKLVRARLFLQEADGLLQSDPRLSYEKLRYAVQIVRGMSAKDSGCL